MPGATALLHRNTPLRLVSNTESQVSSDVFHARESEMPDPGVVHENLDGAERFFGLVALET